jgi:hypothetical protein
MTVRLPAHIEVAAIRRLAESHGGFAAVLAKGDRDAGTIAIVIICRGQPGELYERRPQLDGNRPFLPTLIEDTENKSEFIERIDRLRVQDPDLWLIEADIPDKERFVAALPG